MPRSTTMENHDKYLINMNSKCRKEKCNYNEKDTINELNNLMYMAYNIAIYYKKHKVANAIFIAIALNENLSG